MKATNKLRFVERKDYTEDAANPTTMRILQQWWEQSSMGTMSMGFGDPIPLGKVTGEWRDVPVEKEA